MRITPIVFAIIMLIATCNGISISSTSSNAGESHSTSWDLDLDDGAAVSGITNGKQSSLQIDAKEGLNAISAKSDNTAFNIAFPGNLSSEINTDGGQMTADVAVNGYTLDTPTPEGIDTAVSFQLVNVYYGPWGVIPGYTPTNADWAMMALTYDWSGYTYDPSWVGYSTTLVENDADMPGTVTANAVASELLTVQEKYDAYTLGNTFQNGYSIRTRTVSGVKQEIPTVMGDRRNSIDFENFGKNGVLAYTTTYRDPTRKKTLEYHSAYNSAYPWSANASGPETGKYDFRTVAGNEIGHVMGLNDLDITDAWYVKYIPERYRGVMNHGLTTGTRRVLSDGEISAIRSHYT